jgi:predicted ATPase
MPSSRPLSLLRRLAQLQERSAYARRPAIETLAPTRPPVPPARPSSSRALATTTTLPPKQTEAPTAAQQQPPTTNRLTASYNALVERGSLVDDAGQRAVVARLASLLEQVDAYSHAHAHHAAEEKAWRERVASRLEALEEAERERDEREAAAAAAEAEARAGRATATAAAASSAESAAAPSPSGGGWLSWLLSSTAPSPSDPPQLPLPLESPASAAARVRRAAAERRAARVRAEVGPPPPPPSPPRGVYIYGGVGSGKTMLMDLFFAAAVGEREGFKSGSNSSSSAGSGSSASLRYARRLHFNAAMIELHQRLHRIEKERRRRQQEQQQDGDGGDDDPNNADPDNADHDSHAHQVERTVRDAEARKRKAARSAVLAVRRHLRRQRLGRVSEEAIAASDAEIMRQAVRAMIRGSGGEGGEEEEEKGEEDAAAGAPGAAAAGALVALDEMQAPDPFSVVFMRSLVRALRSERSVIVATSNRSPWSLPSAGLHESLHSSFIDGLVDAVDVVRLGGAGGGGEEEQQQQQQEHVDYRRVALERWLSSSALSARGNGEDEDDDGSGGAAAGLVPPTRAWPPLEEQGGRSSSSSSYFWPLGPAASAAMDARWREFAGEEQTEAFELQVGWGRTMTVARWKRKQGAGDGGRRAARFTFDELCAGLLGPSDYYALAASFDAVFIDGVPRLSMRQRDKARRFITCVDELYNARRELVVSAAASPEVLFAGGGGGGGGGGGEGEGKEGQHDDDAEPLVDLEQLQFETAAEGARLRRDVTLEGGVAPVASTEEAKRAAAQVLGGEEERFAFARAASRLLEMAAAAAAAR